MPSAFETYCTYLSLKTHFSQEKYDYFKYSGKSKFSVDSFMARRDRHMFQRLSRKFTQDTLVDHIVANFIKDRTWVGDLLDDDADDAYLNYIRINQSLTYKFMSDLDKMFQTDSPIKCFKPRKDTYPIAFMHYLSCSISIQTLTIINNIINFIPKWDEKYADDVILPKHSFLIKKYTPFLKYDRDKMLIIFKDKIKEYDYGVREEQKKSNSASTQAANVA